MTCRSKKTVMIPQLADNKHWTCATRSLEYEILNQPVEFRTLKPDQTQAKVTGGPTGENCSLEFSIRENEML